MENGRTLRALSEDRIGSDRGSLSLRNDQVNLAFAAPYHTAPRDAHYFRRSPAMTQSFGPSPPPPSATGLPVS
jgi:hypothetical protein